MKKVYKASSPGCSRVLESVLDKYSSRTKSAVSRLLMLVCFAVLGLSASVSAQCPNGSCSITCPSDISLCLATDDYGHSEITQAWVASLANPSGPSTCTLKRVWRDANGDVELEAGQSIWVDCDDVGDHIDLWVSVEKPLWVECRSSLVRVRIHIKDCEPPAVACPPMGMYVCNDDVPRPGTNFYIPFAGWFKKISLATFQGLGGSATDACGVDFVVYRDQETVDPVCKTNRTIDREFWVFDVNGNHRHCNQMLVVADNVPPTFVEDPGDLVLICDASDAVKINAINQWLDKNRHPGDQAGQDAVVGDNCDENMVMIVAAPGTPAAILAQMPNACDPNPREVIVVFTANDGCGNAATRSAKVVFLDNERPNVPPILNSFYECASQVPPPPNLGVVIDARDNCTPTNKLKIELIGGIITSNGCPDKFTEVRTYRITDCDGNFRDRTHTIIVNDDVAPYWNPAPKPLFLMNICNPADLTTQIQGWMNDNGGGTPLDNCGTPTVTVDKAATDVATDLRRFCLSPGNNLRTATVTFTARDACGNTRTATATVRLMDTQPPTGTPPAYATYDCADDVPQMLTNQVIFLSDNCHDGNSVKVEIESNPPAMEGCEHYPYFLTRKWRLTDCAGNTSIVSQTIRIADLTPPQWTTFPDGIDLDCTDGALNTKLNAWLTSVGGGGVALDQCSGSNLTYSADNFHNSVNKILDRLGPCAPKAGTTTVTFYAKDECGNSVSRTTVVNIRDNTPPTATPRTSQYSCLSQVPPVDPAVITDEADSCSPNPPTVMFLSQSDNGGAGCMASPLVITRWYKLTDCSNNTASVSHQITVIDMIAPQALCKALDRNLGAITGIVTVPATAFDNGSFDNCMIDKIQISRTNGGPWFESLTFDCADIPDIPNCGANVQNSNIVTVFFRVTDKCGNVDYCTTTITLHDVEPPTITCPDDKTINTDNNGGYDCKAAATWTHPVPHDNCSVKCMEMEVQKEINGVFVTINPNNGAQSPNYVTNVITQAGQPAGPYLFGKGPYCDDDQYKIIYRVRDEHGNNKPGVMCMFVITVKDNEAPMWNDCPTAPIVAQTVTNDCYQMKCYKRPTAFDNCEYPGGPCPAPTVTVSVSDPTVMINQVGDEDCALFPVGRTVVTYTAEDAVGNTSTCTVEVLISDPQPPVAMCAGPFTVNMEPDGAMQLSIADIDAPGTMDNCGICAKEIKRATSAYGPTVTLTCADVGTTVAITMRVKDCAAPVANEATCVAMVTVQDMQSPGVAFCPADISVGTDDDVCQAVVDYTPPSFNDGCGSPHPGVLTQGLASGSTFPIGVTHVQYSYTSASGYTVYCDFNVTVEDDEAPSITCPPNVLNLTCLQILPAPMTAGQMMAASLLSDNCGVTALESSDYDNDLTHCAYDGIRTIIRTYTAWDAAGNSATCTQTFQYVEDVTPPVLAYKPADLSFQCADDIPPVQPQSATDNCGDVVIDFSEEVQPNGCENKLVVIRYWVASDACGNTATWRQTITVDDTTPPELYAKPLRRHYACADDVAIAPYQFATDNCDVAFVEFSETTDPGECHNKFTIERRWVAYDLCGNSSTWEQQIIVNDSIPPVLSATPVDRTYECAEEVEAAPVQVATDNCGVVTLNFEETTNPGSCPNQYEIYRRWYAYDLCGNTAEHWQTITVHDDVPPVLLTTPVDRTYECAEDVPAAPVGNATDNCDVVFVDFSESTINGDCHNQFTVVRRWLATDLCGNTDEHWQHITVFDGKAPEFDQMVPPAVVNVDCAQEVPAAAVLTATDNCDGSVVVIYSEELVPGDCDDKFSIIRTWTAEDLCGNLLRYTQRINVYDDEAPVWDQVAPMNPVVECSEEVPAVPVQTATDNCGNPVTMDFSEVTVPGTCANQYMVVRTWVAMDACGNATTRVQTITISDIIAPVLAGLPAATVSIECSEAVPAVPVVTASDNCDDPIDLDFTEVEEPGTCPNQYVIVRTWSAADDCGNATSFVQTITISDTEAPVWDQDAPETPVNVECSQEVPAVPVQTATDNCDVPVDINFNEVINWGTCTNQFQVVRTWTAADDCGNIVTRVQVINVSDTESPVLANLPDAEVNVECSEQVPAVANVTASDNCGDPLYFDFSEVEIPGSCPNQYSITRTWFAQDDCGNSTIFVQTINISDTEAPVMAGLPADDEVDVECSEQVPAVPVVTATDNCDVPIVIDFSEVEIPGSCPNQYSITRTWIAQDDCGNSTYFVQTINISDTEAPVMSGLPAAVVNVECSEQVPAVPVVTATDNCDVPIVIDFSEVEVPGTCPNQYSITRTWIAQDDCGNSTYFVQTINISDTEAPVLAGLPAAVVNVECSEQVPAVPVVTATDNCAAPIVLDFSEVEIPGTCPNQYVITRTWKAQDDCGNSTSFVQTITISDTKAPVMSGLPAATVNVECSEQVPAVPVVTVTDNCASPIVLDFSEVEIPGTCPNQYVIKRTWSAQDDCGNATSFVQTITVSDIKAPVLAGLPAATVNVECSEQVPAVPVVTATDNCAAPIVLQFSEVEIPGTCPNQYVIKRTWSAQDDCGNATSFVQTITVSDTKAPVFGALPAAVVNVECSEQVPALAVVTATDNCAAPVDVEISEIEIPGTCPNQYSITRTWTAEDDCGNSTFFVQTINISDIKAPVFGPLPAAVVNVECSEQVPALAVVTATDNCAAPVDVEISEIEIPGTCPNQYSITRTWTAEDDCGNSTFFVQTINISDILAPTWDQAAPATPVNVECSEQVPPVPVQTATDNCIKPIFVDFSEVIVPGTCPNQFSLTRTWIAQDDCGNAATRVQVINVSDTKAPVLANLPAAVVNVECSEQVPALANVTATDNCAAPVDVEISEIEIPGTCPNQYSITRTWTAEDDCGNSTFFVQTINISDTEAPQWDAAVPALWINEIHYDNIGTDADEFIEVAGTEGLDLSNYSIVLYNGANGQSYGTMNLTGSIDAESNGFGARSFSYPVNGVQNGSPDGMALVLNGNMVLQFLSYEGAFMAVDGPANGMMSTDIGVFEDGSTGIDSSLSLTGTGNKYSDFVWNAPAGATAGSLNTGQTMTVAAGLVLPVNLTLQCGEDVPMPLVLTATDNCNAPVDVEYSEVFLPGAGPNDGVTIIRTWTAEDDCGNAIAHTQTITVNDAEAPVLVGTPAAVVAVDCSENVPAVAVVTVSDNCQGTVDLDFSEVEVPGTCPNQYSLVRTWSATDFAGNTAVFTQTITINDTQAPVFSQVPTTPLNFTCAADVPAAPAITASDNCNAPVFVDFSETVTPGSCLNKFTLVRTWVAQDDCGNGTSIQQVINVNDNVAPVMSCPAPLMAQCSPAEHPPYANLTEFQTAGGTASDNCGLNVNSFGMISEVANGNIYTRTYRVVDQCGNAGTCTQTVTVMDTQPPVFLNCPTGPLVFGNDPDMCWAKVNWPPPVAVDNCSIPTVVQTSGPTSGTIVNVGTYTVSFTATDAMGNTKVCSFQVMVMDTQNPEFDADIVMPGNITVECDAVPAPFVLTTDDVHDNCTPSNLLVIVFTEVRTNGNCKFNYTLTRTWKVTDQAGKMLVHTQIVTVRDTKPPTALCKNATVTLDKFGAATVTAAAINNGSFDNCSAQADLTLTVTPSAFTCANLGANVVTLRVTDECGNSATCTAIVTVLEGIAPCTPQYSVLTTCMGGNGNATTLENGQFRDRITIKSLAMQTWTLQSSTGFYSTTSPAPPGAPIALASGTTFTAGTADGIDNDGDGLIDEADEMIYYTLSGVHVECIGYSITVANNLGQTGTISNKACYPTPYFTNLNDPFCLSTPPFTIGVAETNGATGTVINVMVNGVPTTIFNAAQLGIGFHTVMATFDAGSATTNLVINGVQVGGSMAQALADPGCQQKITKIVQITNTPTTIVCNDLVNLSLHNDGGDCVFVIAPDDVLEGSYLCDDDYSVVLTYPFGTHTFNPANRVDYTHIGKTLNYNLVHAISGNVCWGKIKVEDKEPPVLTCPSNITIKCSDPTATSFTGNVLISDCSPTINSLYSDAYTDLGSCNNPRARIIRTWLVTDGSGNQSTCSQTITISPFDLADVQFPADVTLNCANVNSTDPNATGVPTINGSPIGTGGLCMASISKTDEYYDICPGSYEIVRTWKVRNMCLPVGAGNPVEKVQVIKIIDTQGPVFDCPSNFVVSTDPFTCCATANLPDVIITEACSKVASLTYKVTGIDITTGNLVLIEGSGSLADFPGNNYWNPDTMAVFGFTSCLPLGDYTVTYTAVDGCGNVSDCTFTMTVEDQIPPIAVCDEFTQVALGIDGMAFINAYTFDDGSYDVCYDVHFKARRMFPDQDSCQTDTLFFDQVKFCCTDINDTILVVFRVYDVPVPNGTIGLDDYDGHFNDCMVQVYVEDKIKPLCNAPANVTVSCENFDPSLWAYGFATSGDNCCVDTITHSVSYSLFDTLCSKGTITRTFRAFDCGGLSSQCTQRVFVTYEQDYFVKFPNDVIVTVCNGTGIYGEPTFFGEDCELLGVSHEDEVFTVVPDACFKIERTWTIINWCTYNPNAGCINVPNPNPNATSNHPSNLPGPTVSPLGTPAPWAPTVVAILPGQTPTNYSTFWNANANCYKYKQIIKVIDTQKPVVTNCPTSPVEVCDITPNNTQLWNESYWFDNATAKHDLCEAPTDLTITATDLCSGASVNIRYLLFLDLDNNGDMETVISSTNLPGFNNVQFGNAFNPNFGGGTPRAFDERPVLSNQKYGFALQTTISGTEKTGSVRWNTQQQPSNYVVPELPYGTHKIKWIVEDGCGNETVCEYTFVVKDCKKPTVVCLNGLSVNIMPTQMIQLWANDFLQYTEDNCTPSDKLVIGIRRSGTGTGFPTNPDGTPQTSVTFTCNELGTQLVELWSMDLAGNADYCETYVIVQDPNGFCSNAFGSVAGVLKTEADKGLEDANIELDGSSPALPPTNMFQFSKQNGNYLFAGVPYLGDYTVTPTKDNDPLNGVSTYDLVLINKHILGLEPLNSPYKMIAADANNSRSITTFDIVELRKLILGIYTELPNNTSWRFVDQDFLFPNQLNPFETIFPETKQIADMQTSMSDENFVSVKVGDVNLNAVASSLFSSDDRTEGTLMFDVQDRTVKAGETFTLNVRAAERNLGYQFTMHFPNLEVVDVAPGAEMTMNNFGIFNSDHSLTTSFDNSNIVAEFAVTFRAKAAGTISQMLTVSSRITKAEAYDLNRNRQSVALRFNGNNGTTVTGLGFELYQNQPNPWTNKTQIGFYLPKATEATLTIFDESGRTVFTQTGDFSKGYNAFAIERALVNTTGVLFYKLETTTDSAVKKMIQTK